MSGKGDKQRPRGVSQKEFSERWDTTFGLCECYHCNDEKPKPKKESPERTRLHKLRN